MLDEEDDDGWKDPIIQGSVSRNKMSIMINNYCFVCFGENRPLKGNASKRAGPMDVMCYITVSQTFQLNRRQIQSLPLFFFGQNLAVLRSLLTQVTSLPPGFHWMRVHCGTAAFRVCSVLRRPILHDLLCAECCVVLYYQA